MKATALFVCFLIAGLYGKAQSISFANNKETHLRNPENINLPKADSHHPIATLYFKVNNLKKGQTVHIKLSDKAEGTAKQTSDYSYENSSLVSNLPIDNTKSPVFAVDIKTITDKSLNVVLNIEMTSDNPKIDTTYKVQLNLNTSSITPRLSQKQIVPDTSKWYFRIVTGGNFDFFNGPTIKDFAGDISLFIPNMIRLFKLPIGVELGMNNYHYFNSDSTHTINDGGQNYFLNNKDYYSPADSSKIVRSTPSVNRKYDYNVWGIHANVLTPVSSNEFTQVYAEIHFEELATTETYTPTLAGSVNDTITYSQYNNLYNNGTLRKVNGSIPFPSAHAPVFYPYKQHTYYDIYAGVGFFANINVKNTAKFCYSITGGPAFIELAQPNFDPDPAQRDIIGSSGSTRETKLYVLNKFQLVTTVAPVDIALGGEYRTVAGNMHYFTTYIGATITLDKLKR